MAGPGTAGTFSSVAPWEPLVPRRGLLLPKPGAA